MLAVKHLQTIGLLNESPVIDSIAAISCGIYKGKSVLDLDYIEDSNAEADSNFVLTGKGGIVEVQATAEEFAFSDEQFMELMSLAKKGCAELTEIQKSAL